MKNKIQELELKLEEQERRIRQLEYNLSNIGSPRRYYEYETPSIPNYNPPNYYPPYLITCDSGYVSTFNDGYVFASKGNN